MVSDFVIQYDMNKKRLAECVQPLLLWYSQNCRDLPWRQTKDPYRIWLSEIMLQQTRVGAVIEYYHRFLEQYPDVFALAKASEDMVLKSWEGLGYYSRARNLQKAARIVASEYGGIFPRDYDSIRKLPGIGDYTAGAVASIAYGLPYAAVDGNVLRIVSRILADSSDISDEKVKKRYTTDLSEILTSLSSDISDEKVKKRYTTDLSEILTSFSSKCVMGKAEIAGSLNQAFMDLGSAVCLPNSVPLCEQCPLNNMCRAHKLGKEMEYPYKSPKKERVIEEKTVFVIHDGDEYAIRKRPGKGILAGMYEFPNTPGHLDEQMAVTYLSQLGFTALQIEKVTRVKHVFTHREWHMKCYFVRIGDREYEQPNQGKLIDCGSLTFADRHRLAGEYALPTAFRKLGTGLGGHFA